MKDAIESGFWGTVHENGNFDSPSTEPEAVVTMHGTAEERVALSKAFQESHGPVPRATA